MLPADSDSATAAARVTRLPCCAQATFTQTPTELARIKANLRILYEAGPGARTDDRDLEELDHEDDEDRVGRRRLHPHPRRDLPRRAEPEAPDPPHQRLLAAGGAARRGRALQAGGAAPARRSAQRARPAPAGPPLAAADRGRRAGPVLGRPRRHHPADTDLPAKQPWPSVCATACAPKTATAARNRSRRCCRSSPARRWRSGCGAPSSRATCASSSTGRSPGTWPRLRRRMGDEGRRSNASRRSSACCTTTPAAATCWPGCAPTTSSR